LSAIATTAVVATLDGDLEGAVSVKERLLALGEELGAPGQALMQASAATARSLIYLGRPEEWLTLESQQAELAGVEGQVQATYRARALAYVGKAAEAREALAVPLQEWVMSRKQDEVQISYLFQLLEPAVLAEHQEAVAILVPLLAPVSHLAAVYGDPTCLARHLGAGAALLGEPEQARAYYLQALEVCAKIRHRPDIALTRLGLAELLLAEAEKGDASPLVAVHPELVKGRTARGSTGSPRADEMRREALEHLDFAIEEFREMKMQPSLERALRHKELLKA